MKLSFAISIEPTRFGPMALSTDFWGSVAQLASLGYKGIEIGVRDPAKFDIHQSKELLGKQRLTVPVIGTVQAYLDDNLSFTDRDESVREQAILRVKSHIALAREFNGLVGLGLIRGRLQRNVSTQQAHSWLLDALRKLAVEADSSDVRLAIEPINRYETDLLNTVSEALALINEIDSGNVGILFDTFHSNIEEAHLDESLRSCGTHLFHVHIADSNRLYPGAGHTNFKEVVSTLREINYSGWLSVEVMHRPDMATAAEQAMKFMKPLLG
jgi:sugar phosphate isomerase/epimerase